METGVEYIQAVFFLSGEPFGNLLQLNCVQYEVYATKSSVPAKFLHKPAPQLLSVVAARRSIKSMFRDGSEKHKPSSLKHLHGHLAFAAEVAWMALEEGGGKTL
eukprot:RCo032699